MASSAFGETLAVAVASNFAPTLRGIAADYSAVSGDDVQISTGSTGHLFAQIRNGAPYDVFLSADAERPALLEDAGLAVKGSRFTYALGRLALWSRDEVFANSACDLLSPRLAGRKIAIANPRLAPYGAAAKHYLQGQGLWETLESQLVYGENIAQTLHFVASGNAAIGIVAQSQLADAAGFDVQCTTLLAADTHEPIRQQAVQLARARDKRAAARFLDWLKNDARAAIASGGYDLPEAE